MPHLTQCRYNPVWIHHTLNHLPVREPENREQLGGGDHRRSRFRLNIKGKWL